MSKMKMYYMLITSVDGKWYPQFGDYDRSVVVEERNDYQRSGDYKRGDLKVIKTGDTQSEINAAIAALNV